MAYFDEELTRRIVSMRELVREYSKSPGEQYKYLIKISGYFQKEAEELNKKVFGG